MQNNTQENEISAKEDPASGCFGPIIWMLLAGWIVTVVYVSVTSQQTVSMVMPPNSQSYYLALRAGIAVLVLIPALLLGYLWRQPAYRAVFQTWALAALPGLALLPVELLSESAAQSRGLLHVLVLGLYLILLIFLKRRRLGGNRATFSSPPLLFASLLIGGLMLYPWLAWGALGSWIDTIIYLLVAIAIGLSGAYLLANFLIPVLMESEPTWRSFILVALSASVALLLLGGETGFPFGGMQLLLMLVLSATGPVLVGLIPIGRPDRASSPAVLPLTLLVGLAAAGPLLFIDPDELTPIVSGTQGDLFPLALQAVTATALTGWILGIVLFSFFLVRAHLWTAQKRSIQFSWAEIVAGLLALAVFVGGAYIYFFLGQPGFYGERLFVILKDQADLSGAKDITDYQERRAFVYQTLVQHASTTQEGLRKYLDSRRINYTPYYLENSLEVDADPYLAWILARRPEVDRIQPSPQLRPLPRKPPVSTGTAPAPQGPPWNIQYIGADRVWSELGVTGKGIVIGQSDSGADASHPELASTFRGKDGNLDFNWFDPWYGLPKPYDLNGHGTHTLGTALGQTVGVAPGATWYACVNLARNLGNPPLYLDCMQFMLAPFPINGDPFQDGDPSLGAHVSNNSWGCPELEGCDERTLQVAAQALRAAGIFVEASAGNNGPYCSSIEDPLSPYASVWATGAIDRQGNLINFSSRGPVDLSGPSNVKPDIVAPGSEVLSAFPQDTYASLAGTSMAGPHVTGVVALMWSANPDLIGDIEKTDQILAASAKAYTGPLPNCPGAAADPSTAVGYGVLDAYQAVKMALGSR